MKTEKHVGYWRGNPRKSISGDKMVIDEPELPDVHDFIDKNWDKIERKKVIQYLRSNKKERYAWMGWSTCRICGCMNGSTCLTDGRWVWPEGFLHYITNHNVKPPMEFLEYLKQKNAL